MCVAAFPLDKGEGKAVSDKHRLKGSSIPALGNVSQTLGFFSQSLGRKSKLGHPGRPFGIAFLTLVEA